MSEECEKIEEKGKGILEQLEAQKEELKVIEVKWDTKKTVTGKCDTCYEDNQKTMKFLDTSYCKKSFDENKSNIKYKIEQKLAKVEEEIKFQKILARATRFNHLKDMVQAVRAIIKQKENNDYDYKFSEEDKEQGVKLFKALKKIKPKSSPFIDRGVSINRSLFLSGSISKNWHSHDNDITLTALDEADRYNAIARVQLTFKEAERLRSLLTDCIEHCRIEGMMAKIKEEMKLEESETGDEES